MNKDVLQGIRLKLRELNRNVLALTLNLDRIDETLNKIESRLKSIESIVQTDGSDSDDGQTQDTEIPAEVNDEHSLKLFAQALLGEQIFKPQPPENIRELSKKLRDNLVKTYSTIELHPKWTSVETSHLDAIYLPAERLVIDFVRSSTDGGVLVEKLQWLQVPE